MNPYRVLGGASGATTAAVAGGIALVAIGLFLWIGGASLLAGRWLPLTVRLLGIVAGTGTVVMSVGLLFGGVGHALTWTGGVGYQIALPSGHTC
jgi:hypothetical protein